MRHARGFSPDAVGERSHPLRRASLSRVMCQMAVCPGSGLFPQGPISGRRRVRQHLLQGAPVRPCRPRHLPLTYLPRTTAGSPHYCMSTYASLFVPPETTVTEGGQSRAGRQRLCPRIFGGSIVSRSRKRVPIERGAPKWLRQIGHQRRRAYERCHGEEANRKQFGRSWWQDGYDWRDWGEEVAERHKRK